MADREPPLEKYDYFKDLESGFAFIKDKGEMSDEFALLVAEGLIQEFKTMAHEAALQNPAYPEDVYLTFIYGSNVEGLFNGKGGPGGLKLALALEALQSREEKTSTS